MNRRRQWDIFCKVIDNYGDLGVAWRLAKDLATRGQAVRLWVDDASALAWMAPGGALGVDLMAWPAPGQSFEQLTSGDVLVEAFGCDIPEAFIAQAWQRHAAGAPPPCWINLEYLSAETYVERCHGLPSPVLGGPAAGWQKWFFYPGFTPATGGLLREPDLSGRQLTFDRRAWLLSQQISADSAANEVLVSLFCYEPPALAPLLAQWARAGLAGRTVRLLVTAGRAAAAVRQLIPGTQSTSSRLTAHYLPWLSQTDFDHLLWASDLNFVRGEDSLVRALWAAKPLIWQIYPQDDNAHLLKLDAFLSQIGTPDSQEKLHQLWNAPAPPSASALEDLDQALDPAALGQWTDHALALRTALERQQDLSTQLLQFVDKKS